MPDLASRVLILLDTRCSVAYGLSLSLILWRIKSSFARPDTRRLQLVSSIRSLGKQSSDPVF